MESLGSWYLKRFLAALKALPEEGRSPRPDDPLRGKVPRKMALARLRSMAGSGPMPCLRAQPFYHARTIPPPEFGAMGRWFLSLESFIAQICPCCDEAEVTQHWPLIHAMSRVFKRLAINNSVEDGSPFMAITGFSAHGYCCARGGAEERLHRELCPQRPLNR